jgi:hypothetical protein
LPIGGLQRYAGQSRGMVNGVLPRMVAKICTRAPSRARRERRLRFLEAANAATIAGRAFVQILAKLCFFKLIENLRCIVFKYGPNHPFPANWPFKAPC